MSIRNRLDKANAVDARETSNEGVDFTILDQYDPSVHETIAATAPPRPEQLGGCDYGLIANAPILNCDYGAIP